ACPDLTLEVCDFDWCETGEVAVEDNNAACRATVCGDREREGSEGCDDGNTDDGDGCSSTCTAEEGFGCTDDGTCHPIACGDGSKDHPEACDDGGATEACADDCSAVNDGWPCPYGEDACRQIVCGDGFRDYPE